VLSGAWLLIRLLRWLSVSPKLKPSAR